MSVFVGVGDRFKGITVTSKEEPCSIEHFTEKLKASLEKWTTEVRNIVILGGERVSIPEYPRSKEGRRETLKGES